MENGRWRMEDECFYCPVTRIRIQIEIGIEIAELRPLPVCCSPTSRVLKAKANDLLTFLRDRLKDGSNQVVRGDAL